MSAFGSPTEISILNHVMGLSSFTMPSSLYCALFTSSMGANDLEQTTPVLTSEVSGGSYARVDILTSPKFGSTAVTNGSWVTSIANDAAIDFAQATASWGTIRYVAIMSSSSGAGTVYLWGQLVQDKVISTNDTFSFAIGDLIITLD